MPMIKVPLTVEYGLLGFVRQQPLHGYEIYQRLCATEDFGLTWGWKQSQLYAELTRLEQDGYLTSAVETQGTRPPRKVFQLTEKGITTFTDWITCPVPHGRDFQLEFPVKLYFAQHEGTDAASVLVARQQAACQRWLDDLQAQDQPYTAGPGYTQLVRQFRMSQIETILAWLATCSAQQEAVQTE